MNLTENNIIWSFIDNVEEINNLLDTYANISREDLFEDCIHKKLQTVLKEYCKELDWTSKYLVKQESMRVLKTLTRLQREEDKDVILQNTKESEEDE